MTNILLVVRVKRRPEQDPGYLVSRLRDQVGECVDWFPEDVNPGLEIIDNQQFRIIRVTGAVMTTTIADMLVARDLLAGQDIGKGFEARARLWQIKLSDIPVAALNALRTKVPFAQRGTIYDASFTLAALQNFWRQKVVEPRDGLGQPSDDGMEQDDV